MPSRVPPRCDALDEDKSRDFIIEQITAMKFRLVVLLALTLTACEEQVNTSNTGLGGRWVNTSTNTDTLTFIQLAGETLMTLERGKETRNGVVVPKSGFGPYEYKLLPNDTVSLRWMLSSNSAFNQYYFKQTRDILVIGKFFDSGTSGDQLVFLKLK